MVEINKQLVEHLATLARIKLDEKTEDTGANVKLQV